MGTSSTAALPVATSAAAAENPLPPTTRPLIRGGKRRGFMFGPRLKEEREKRKQSLEAAARGIGIYASTLMRLERQQRGASNDVVEAIEAYYGVKKADLRTPV